MLRHFLSSRSPATTVTSLLQSLGAIRRLTAATNNAVNQETSGAEPTLKRFWKDVGIEKRAKSYAVTLDKRPLKTPSGNALLLPRHKPLVASLIAAEWDNQERLIKPHALPMTSLAARAIDAFKDKETCDGICASLLRYLDTDTICFYQDHPSHLVDLQARHWDPLHDWIQNTYGIKIQKTNSILFNSQTEETKQALKIVLESLDQWELAAMERTTLTTKSFIIALALVKRHIGPEEACLAAHVEVNSQIERWGEVEDTHDVDYHDIRRQLAEQTRLRDFYSTMPPLSLPQQWTYTSCWCEENIYLLCLHFLGDRNAMDEWNIYAVFISNQSKTVALWKQRRARSPSSPVVWDYHVVLLLTSRGRDQIDQSWIYDFDTILPMPCPAQDYLEQVFSTGIDEQYASLFRIVPGGVFVDNFASDRTHMLREGTSEFLSPPPNYPPILGILSAKKGIKMNLMSSFVCMKNTEDTFGEVMDVGEMMRFVTA